MSSHAATPTHTAPHQSRHEPRQYQVNADRIEQIILHDRLAPGARLPPERELAARLGISRAALREALIALELGGIVDVRGASRVVLSAANCLRKGD